jgi:hypothetical protein
MVMLDVVGLVRVTERHPDSFDFRLAEILEHERLDAGLGFDSLVKIAAPPVGTQLARPNDENVATNHFNPFHKSHLPKRRNGHMCREFRDKLISTIQSESLMLGTVKIA